MKLFSTTALVVFILLVMGVFIKFNTPSVSTINTNNLISLISAS